MKHLYEAIQERASAWRGEHYPCADYPTIGEILEYAVLPESDNLRYLRRPQLRALEAYWYLRLVEGTPRIPICTPAISRRRASGSAQITDWRAMVDSVMIDPAHDGQVFSVALSDIPERKTDLVAGATNSSLPPVPPPWP